MPPVVTYDVQHPDPDFNRWDKPSGLTFVAGHAQTSDPELLKKFRTLGWALQRVPTTAPAPKVEEPEPPAPKKPAK